MHHQLNELQKNRHTVTQILMLILLVFYGCKSINDEVTLDDHLANLMNNRKYDDVISTVDALKEPEKSNPAYLMYRAQAFYGMAGFDMVSLTKLAVKGMNFNELERSFSRLLKSDNTAAGISQKTSVSTVKSVVSFAGYMKIMEFFPDLKDSSRPLLMESLLTLQKIPEKDDVFYRKARTQSFMLHSVIMLSSVKKSIRNNLQQDDVLDMFCMIDASTLSSELLWIVEHLSGALDDAEILRRKSGETTTNPGQLEKIQQKMKEFLANLSRMSPGAISSEIMAAQSLQCAQ